MEMLGKVRTVLMYVLNWIGDIVTSLVSADGALKELLPLFCIGIAVAVFMFAMKAIRKVTWGA